MELLNKFLKVAYYTQITLITISILIFLVKVFFPGVHLKQNMEFDLKLKKVSTVKISPFDEGRSSSMYSKNLSLYFNNKRNGLDKKLGYEAWIYADEGKLLVQLPDGKLFNYKFSFYIYVQFVLIYITAFFYRFSKKMLHGAPLNYQRLRKVENIAYLIASIPIVEGFNNYMISNYLYNKIRADEFEILTGANINYLMIAFSLVFVIVLRLILIIYKYNDEQNRSI